MNIKYIRQIPLTIDHLAITSLDISHNSFSEFPNINCLTALVCIPLFRCIATIFTLYFISFFQIIIGHKIAVDSHFGYNIRSI